MSDRASLDRMLEDCLEVMEDACSEWEIAFLESLRDQFALNREPTFKQEGKLGQVYDKVLAWEARR